MLFLKVLNLKITEALLIVLLRHSGVWRFKILGWKHLADFKGPVNRSQELPLGLELLGVESDRAVYLRVVKVALALMLQSLRCRLGKLIRFLNFQSLSLLQHYLNKARVLNFVLRLKEAHEKVKVWSLHIHINRLQGLEELLLSYDIDRLRVGPDELREGHLVIEERLPNHIHQRSNFILYQVTKEFSHVVEHHKLLVSGVEFVHELDNYVLRWIKFRCCQEFIYAFIGKLALLFCVVGSEKADEGCIVFP